MKLVSYTKIILRQILLIPVVKNPRNLKGNLIIKVTGNSAWILCDNIWEYEYNNVAEKQTNMQIAFFEKVNGEWKFSFDAFIQKPVAKAEASE